MMTLQLKVSCALVQLQRATENTEGEFDPVSGFSREEIESWLAETAAGLNPGCPDMVGAAAACRRLGIAF